MRTVLATVCLAFAILITGCSAQAEQTPLSCPSGYVVEYDDDGAECEIDSDGDGEDDENQDEAGASEEEDDSDSRRKKSRRKARSRR